MKNLYVMNRKLNRLTWKIEEGEFRSDTSVIRQPFGTFWIAFAMNLKTGRTVLSFKNEKYRYFTERKEAEDWEAAREVFMEYFERVDNSVKEVDKSVEEEARRAYERVISEGMAKKFTNGEE